MVRWNQEGLAECWLGSAIGRPITRRIKMSRQLRITFTTDEEKAGSVIADLVDRRVSNMEFAVLTDDGREVRSSIAIAITNDASGPGQRTKGPLPRIS